MALSDSLHPALASASVPIAAVSQVDDYGFWAQGVWGEPETRMLDAIGSFTPSSDPGRAHVAEVAAQVARLRGQLLPFDDGNWGSPVIYPTSSDPFPSRLAGLAAMIAGGLPLRCVTVSAPGMYDTHADQATDLGSALALTAGSLNAFQRDLEARGLADRVIVHVWSEFGRRGEENGSLGTDHGAAGMGFLIGSQVKGQMLGEFPGLASGLDDEGNLKATFDYQVPLLLASRTVVRDRRGGDHPECGELRPPFAPEVISLRRHLGFVSGSDSSSPQERSFSSSLARSDSRGGFLPDARPGRRG